VLKKEYLLWMTSPISWRLSKVTWKKKGFEVDVAYNGLEGIEKVKASMPDCIVLDVMMPEMDGFKVCQELKKDEKFCEIPIIMLTAVASHVSSTRYSHYDGMSMEADDYLAKPASAEQITTSVRNLLNV
jgi:two-component system, OmpR family, alkaline phosphatase synthesis response regulator PhoP